MAYVISDDCIACGTCIDECPVEAISEGSLFYFLSSPQITQMDTGYLYSTKL